MGDKFEGDGVVSDLVRDFTRRHGYLTPVPGTEVQGLPSRFTFTSSGSLDEVPDDPMIYEYDEVKGFHSIGLLSEVVEKPST